MRRSVLPTLVPLLAAIVFLPDPPMGLGQETNAVGESPAEAKALEAKGTRATRAGLRQFNRAVAQALQMKDPGKRNRAVSRAVRRMLATLDKSESSPEVRLKVLRRVEVVCWKSGADYEARRTSERRYKLLATEKTRSSGPSILNRLTDGERFARLGHSSAAKYYFGLVLAAGPQGPEANRAAMWTGALLLSDGQMLEARDHYRNMARFFAPTNHDAMRQAMFRQADCEEKLGHLAAAQALYTQLIQGHAESPEAEDARHRLREMQSREPKERPCGGSGK